MKKSSWIASIVEIILGMVLVICGGIGILDGYWSGMGGGLIGVGTVFLIRCIRYSRDPEYKEEYDIEMRDERNSFLRVKAWSWAGYLFVMITAVGAIVFKLLGREDLMMFCGMSVCLVVLLYWICYMVLKNRY